jgi:hypothetical protein
MTQKQIAFMVCRILAIMNFITAIMLLGQLTEFLQNRFGYAVFSGGIYLLISLILWFGADIISDSLFSGDGESKIATSITFPQFEVMALVLLGLYILVTSIPSLIASLYMYYSMKNQYLYPLGNLSRVLLTDIIKIVLGGLLVFTPKGILGIIKRGRDAGLPETPDSNS